MKVVKENIFTRKIEIPIFKPAKNKGEGVMKLLKKKTDLIKKIVAGFLSVVILLAQNLTVYSYVAPAPPTAPENNYVAPAPPTAPENNYVAPAPPTAPTLDEILNPTDTPTPEPEVNASNSSSSSDSPSDEGSTSPEAEDYSAEISSHNKQSTDGQTGDTSINTGDANNTGTIVNDVNNNYSGTSSDSGELDGIAVVNSDNGAESDNSGSVKIANNNTSIQDNSASVVNNLNQDTTTGDNSASKNVGDSEIVTGDANTTGTIVNAVNTNVDGVAVAEFNVIDDQVGDIILDFANACVFGCGVGDVAVVNSGNGVDSKNSGELDSDANNYSFQNNDATVENNMTLEANSGDNDANKNTGGNSQIETGDANIAANVVNFVNNNLEGAIIYGVVNIFGSLVGDIILAGGACCFGGAAAANKGNGADSINSANIDQTLNNETAQFNNANIENNLVFDANTGDNNTQKNTNGSSSIETGDAAIDGQVVNVANTNISGGDWWLVIVNEAGKWIGKILGADGNYYGGSDGFEFIVNEAGEILVVNSGNGADSENAASVSQQVNNTTVQNNNANIVNNVALTANTGGNSASKNTGGDSSIATGDANIIANIVNFVNNNIKGDGTLYVMVVNVFGSWLGDFVGLGYEKENNFYADGGNVLGLGGVSAGSSNSNSSGDTGGANPSSSNSQSAIAPVSEIPQVTPTPEFSVGSLVASATIQGGIIDFEGDDTGYLVGGDTISTDKETINVNMAWLLMLIPGYFVITVIRRQVLKLLPAAGK